MKKLTKHQIDEAYLITKRAERERRLDEIEEKLVTVALQAEHLRMEESLTKEGMVKLERLREVHAALLKERCELVAILSAPEIRIEPGKKKVKIKLLGK